ncbi:hypothetical protein EDB89DRAFT_1907734 [Lactarius sanguifluus]|nr:hypothetical protein EDB89DRAFT_1907734 [Lactarius sanguifluus]
MSRSPLWILPVITRITDTGPGEDLNGSATDLFSVFAAGWTSNLVDRCRYLAECHPKPFFDHWQNFTLVSQDMYLRQSVTAQPGQDLCKDQRYAQDDPRWEREVRGATAVLERLLESWEDTPHTEDHVRVGRMSLDELAPRLRLELCRLSPLSIPLAVMLSHRRCLDLIIITLTLVLALLGYALQITLAIAYGVQKTLEHMQQQQTGN